MNEIEAIKKHLPVAVQEAIRNYQTEKLGAARMGCDEVTLDKVAAHAGAMIIARKRRWRPINEGLLSLGQLQKS